jgi:enamine deaminase RidA (YjgF/YER057c/UK114 family)
MAKAEERMAQLGISLPPVPRAVGAYVPAVAVGGLVYTSGQLPLRDGKLVAAGKVPTDVSIADAQAAARVAALNALAAIRSVAGSLDAVSRLVRMNVFVNSAGGFADQAKVANGASELLIEVFAEVGRHTRCAIGAAELPLNAPVEIDLIVETS